MEIKEKYKLIIDTLASIEQDLIHHTNPSHKYDLEDKIKKVNLKIKDTGRRMDLLNKENELQIEYFKFKEHYKLAYELVYAMNDVLCYVKPYFINEELSSQQSVFDHINPWKQKTSINGAKKILIQNYLSLSIEHKTEILNIVGNLSGHKKVLIKGPNYGSKDCPDLGQIIELTLQEGFFFLIKKVLDDKRVDMVEYSPTYLLKMLINYYNKSYMSFHKVMSLKK